MIAFRRFFHLLDSARLRSKLLFGNYYFFINRLRGVEFEGSVSFIGKPKFKLYSGTRIIVGNNCRFISSQTDNPTGLNHPCIITAYVPGTVVRIGENTGLSGTTIGAHISVTIGRNVKCGANTIITDSDWHPEDPRSGKPRPVFIGDNVWLGMNSVILKGVRIGDNVVIGANSVVTKDIPANTIAVGNPCRVVQQLPG